MATTGMYDALAEAARTGEIPQDSITAAFARAVTSCPDRPFLEFGGEVLRYAEADRLSNALANGLAARGVETGQPVATVLDNGIDAVLVWLAINKLGAVSAPVNTAFKGEFLRAQIADCGAAIVIAEAEYAERVAAVAAGLPAMRELLVRGGDLPVLAGVKIDTLDAARSADDAPPSHTVTPDQLAMLVYTSGTTGASKGCMISHNHACNMGWKAVIERGYTNDDILWTPLPLFHLNAIAVTVVTAIIAQCSAAISPRFSVSGFWPEIERTGATVVSLLGSMASLIADAPDSEAQKRAVGQIRRVNAAPFPASVVETWRNRFGVPATGASAYGMTEAATISGMRGDDPPGPPGSSGRVGRDFEVAIVDDGGLPLPLGTAGEIVCRPTRPNIMFQGYWNKPAETVKAWRNLWFHTGDIGRLDADGFLYFVDRKKDYIRRRGENISTFEMETVFRDHPAIQDVAVHSVLSPIGEDEVKVTAELLPGATLSEEDLCRWSIDRVPYFAVPLYIEFRDALPRSATGKILKHELRDEGKTTSTWDREAAGLTFTRR
ncbi:AMP-binding protein [Sphingomonas immobilis]|uniref:AMP-binding protein n=1 Tax=Sphingomonas immobilis TaxID=3063997 RepID=A0ABT9A2H5_9SPHN|nr:AMP-binding protein [Sphingomonas sp. CA1-15]MDO7844047.1 AMP-binding protein [Sphingomonas sp. CA1-15]